MKLTVVDILAAYAATEATPIHHGWSPKEDKICPLTAVMQHRGCINLSKLHKNHPDKDDRDHVIQEAAEKEFGVGFSKGFYQNYDDEVSRLQGDPRAKGVDNPFKGPRGYGYYRDWERGSQIGKQAAHMLADRAICASAA